MKKRKLDNKTLKAFKIGYSGEYNELYKHLKQSGFKDEEILSTGLVNRTDKGEFIDRFRKRLMFPIMDVSGKVIAFGGRKLDENEKMAKYINSNENLVYSKKKHLFGLNLAKQSSENKIILVEGYMDAISLYQRGFDNVVASLGTALTEEQGRLLRRYMDAISLYQRGITNVVASLGTALTEEQGRLLRKYSEQVILSYDSDGAGQTAILRGLSILEEQGIDARVVQMDGAKDPDEYVIKFGSGRFKTLVDNAISLVEFKIKMLKPKYNLENANDKIRFLKEITKILSNVESDIEREIYISKVSTQYGISKEAIYSEINKIIYKKNSSAEKNLNKPIKKEEEKVKVEDSVEKRENLIIYLLINYFAESFERIVSNITLDDIKLPENKKIYDSILSSTAEETEKLVHSLANIEDENLQAHVSKILLTDYDISSVEKCLDDLILVYEKEHLSKRRDQIVKELDSGNLSKDQVSELEQELNDIVIELAKMK